jgi:hypothetical protein
MSREPEPPPRDDLPVEILRPATRRSVLKIFLLSALVVIGFNALAGIFLARRTPNRGYRLLEEKWALLRSIEQPVDWIVLGDSSCNQGVSPAILSQTLGGRAVNLCTMGGAALLNDAWMLQRYLEKHPPPKGVLIVHVYDVWARGVRPVVLAKIPELTLGSFSELQPMPALSRQEWASVAVARFAPLFAENQSLAHLLRSPSEALFRPEIHFEDGFQAKEGADPAKVVSDTRAHLAELAKPGRRPISELNQGCLLRVRQLAEARGLDVFIASAPLFEGLTRAPQLQRANAELQAGIEAIAGHPGGRVRVILRDPPAMPIERLQNVDHVTREGAILYSEELARAVLAARGDSQ